MIFSSRATARWQRGVAGLALAAALALIAACGGSTSQYETFVPKRLFAFGDETSTITATGRKYSVNGLNSSGGIDCTQQPIWVQSVASLYGFAFAECNPSFASEPQAHMLAAPGARVADVAAQVEAQVAAGGFRDGDLVLVLVGANDVLDLYAQYPLRTEADLLVDAGGRGAQLAQLVNRLVDLGAKVVVSNLPDLGISPYAIAENKANPDIDRAALLTRLVTAFNEQLGVKVLLDGRYIGLMQTDVRTELMVKSPASFGLVNVSDGVCTAALPDCTTSTLATGAVPSQYMWADATRLAPGGQNQLATLAIERATRNPF
jgi:phospholipase/lecithinase/hemolysin